MDCGSGHDPNMSYKLQPAWSLQASMERRVISLATIFCISPDWAFSFGLLLFLVGKGRLHAVENADPEIAGGVSWPISAPSRVVVSDGYSGNFIRPSLTICLK